MNVWSLTLQFLPFLYLFYMGVDIYVRDPKNKLHRFTMLLFFSFSSLFLGHFLMNTVPLENAPVPARYIMLASGLLIMSSGLYFFNALNRISIRPVLLHAISAVPLLCLALIFTASPLIQVRVEQGPYWRTEHYSGPLNTIVAITIVYSFIGYLLLLYRAIRSASAKGTSLQERKRLRVIGWGAAFSCAWVVLFNILYIFLKRHVPVIPFDTAAAFSVFFFALFIRYAMINYEFLSTAARRYEILFDQSPSGIVLLDEQGRVMEANQAFLQVIGLSNSRPNHWQHKPISAFVTVMGPIVSLERINQAYQDKESVHLEFQICNFTGNTCMVETTTDYIEVEGRIWTYMMVKDVTLEREHERKLSYLAYHDSLTGLVNRRRFYELLDAAHQVDDGDDRMIAVLLIDLDRFKWVNDTLGHSAGDELLETIARHLRETVPAGSCAARLGGDEFAILVEDPRSYEEIRLLGDRIVERLNIPAHINQTTFEVTASIGICCLPRKDSDPESIMRHADAAMYTAKRNGRNQYHMYGQPTGCTKVLHDI